MFGYTQQFERRRAGRKPDPYNPARTVEDWSNPVISTVDGYIASGESSQQSDPVRDRIASAAEFVSDDPQADIQEGDLLILGNRQWLVTGFPANDINPFTGWQPTLVAKLEEQRG